MPRRPRIHLPHGFYHVTLRGNHQRHLFATDGDRAVLNGIVSRVVEKHDVRIHAYCWMTNHLHLLIQAGTDPLAGPMRQLAAAFARAMQAKLQTTGHYFERRYHAVLVDADSYLLELIRYIHLNPVRAGLVSSPVEYRWSSHHAYIGTRVETWVTTEFVLSMFNADHARAVSAYGAFVGAEQIQEWKPPDTEEQLAADARGRPNPVAPRALLATRGDLVALIAEACRRFDVNPAHLDSPVRDPYLTKVRAWIAHQAKVRHVASMSAVARRLGRDEATLRQAIRMYPGEIE